MSTKRKSSKRSSAARSEKKQAVVYARVVRGDAFVAWAIEHAEGLFDKLSETTTEEFVNKLVRPFTLNGTTHTKHNDDCRKSSSRDSKLISSSSSFSKSKRKSSSSSRRQSSSLSNLHSSVEGNAAPVRLFDRLPVDMTKMLVLAANPADMKDDDEIDYVFLSHTWKRPISELLQYVDVDRWFWIDVVSVLQHKGEDQVSFYNSII